MGERRAEIVYMETLTKIPLQNFGVGVDNTKMDFKEERYLLGCYAV
jgi:hypothetical protein